MAKVALNKSQLKKERDKLALYQKVLPSLELKRMQLTAEFKRARGRFEETREAAEHLREKIARQLPMLAYRRINLSGLVKVARVSVEEENIVGVRVPALKDVAYEIADYAPMAKPHWVDLYVTRAQEMIRARLEARIARERMERLDRAVRRITQRVNLFEKILIPSTRNNIQRIRVFLGDAERSAIVRSKIAKAMHQKERADMIAGEAE